MLGTRRLLTIIFALAAIVAVFLVNRLASSQLATDGSPYHVFPLHDNKIARRELELVGGSTGQVLFYLALLLAAGLTVLIAVATVDGPVRRRIAVLSAPVVTLVMLVNQTLDGWAVSNMNMGHPIYLVPAQWAALATVPLLTFAIALLLLRRREQTLRMVALGRTADRKSPPPKPPRAQGRALIPRMSANPTRDYHSFSVLVGILGWRLGEGGEDLGGEGV